ncbi:MAG: hypothetical protein IPH32_11595 [Bacteroidetes bacterium]|nr:hypothetical protein [Bacteroidota bacterium]
MKKLLLLLCFFSISDAINAQTEKTVNPSINIYNKYLIKLDSNVAFNIQTTSTFIKQVCAATNTNYNNSTKYFEVVTKRNLQRNIIDGKLQKNATPMTEFIYVGQVEYSTSVISNTISTQ